MATYTNTIIIRSDKFKSAGALIASLNVTDLSIDETAVRIATAEIGYNESIDGIGIAIGFWKNFILLTGYRITDLIYNSVTGRHSPTFKRIRNNFPELDALLLFSNDTEMSFVFELIKGGITVRRKQIYHEKLIYDKDYGELLQPELEYYRGLGYTNIEAIKNSDEYKNGYNDIDISLTLIEEFCGQMPDLENLKMNLGINEELGKDYIDNINFDFGDEKSKLKIIIDCINESLPSKKYKIKKQKDFAEDKSKLSSWHQPGQILYSTELYQVTFSPIILCSYCISVEIKMDIRKRHSSSQISDGIWQLDEYFCIRAYIESGITTKQDFDLLLYNLRKKVTEFFLPFLQGSHADIESLIIKKFYTEEYFKMIINAAEKSLSGKNYPFLYQFDDLLIIEELRKKINVPRDENISKYFTRYLLQYEQVISSLTVSHADFLREKFANLILKFG